MSLNQSQICECFNRVFETRYRVILQGGGCEPDYQPSSQGRPAVIMAREDFAASALHEAAHWCVASRKRRALPDYGYSYTPPPRSAAAQVAFFAAEEKVQAVEWYLARRAGLDFRASADDPELALAALDRFQDRLWSQVAQWEGACLRDLPPRALAFGSALEQRVARDPAPGSSQEMNGNL